MLKRGASGNADGSGTTVAVAPKVRKMQPRILNNSPADTYAGVIRTTETSLDRRRRNVYRGPKRQMATVLRAAYIATIEPGGSPETNTTEAIPSLCERDSKVL